MSLRVNLKKRFETLKGQSVVEVAMLLPLLIMFALVLIEMGIVFATYISLVNATHEGAIYASNHGQLADPGGCGSTPNPTCTITADDLPSSGSRTLWQDYYARVSDEVFVSVGERLKAGQLVENQAGDFVVDRPVVGACIGTAPQVCYITTTVHYKIRTFTSSMSLPGVGRLGLPNYYQINYSYGMPLKGDSP